MSSTCSLPGVTTPGAAPVSASSPSDVAASVSWFHSSLVQMRVEAASLVASDPAHSSLWSLVEGALKQSAAPLGEVRSQVEQLRAALCFSSPPPTTSSSSASLRFSTACTPTSSLSSSSSNSTPSWSHSRLSTPDDDDERLTTSWSSTSVTPSSTLSSPADARPVDALFVKIWRKREDSGPQQPHTGSPVRLLTPSAPVKPALSSSLHSSSSLLFTPIAQPHFTEEEHQDMDQEQRERDGTGMSAPPPSPASTPTTSHTSFAFSTPPPPPPSPSSRASSSGFTALSTFQRVEESRRAVRDGEKQSRPQWTGGVDHDGQHDAMRATRLRWEDSNSPVRTMLSSDLLYDAEEDEEEEEEEMKGSAGKPPMSPSSFLPTVAACGVRRRRDDEDEEDKRRPKRVSPASRRTSAGDDEHPRGPPPTPVPSSPRSSPSSSSPSPSTFALTIPALDVLVAARLTAPPSPSPFTLSSSPQPHGHVNDDAGTRTATSSTTSRVFAPSVFARPFVLQPLPRPFHSAFPSSSPQPGSPPTATGSGSGSGLSPSFLAAQLHSPCSPADVSPEGRSGQAAQHDTRGAVTTSVTKHLYNMEWGTTASQSTSSTSQ